MSLQEGDWLYNKVANRHVQTYVKGFVDVSGGDVILRNGNLNVAGRSDLSGDTVMHQNANVRGLIKQSDTIIEGGFIYKEVVDPAIQDSIDEINTIKDSLNQFIFVDVVDPSLIYIGGAANTISIRGDASMDNTLSVAGAVNMDSTLLVEGDVSMNSGLSVDGAVNMDSTLLVQGDVSMNSNFSVDGAVSMDSTLLVQGDVSMNSDFSVDGAVSMDSTLLVQGDVSMNSDFSVDGAVNMDSTLLVQGDVSMNSDFSVDGAVNMDSTLLVQGDVSMNNILSVGGDISVGGNVSMNSDFSVDGAVSMDSTLLVQGDVSMNNGLSIGGDVSMNSAFSVDGAVSMDSTLLVQGDVSMNSDFSVDGAVSMDSILLVQGDVSMNSDLSVGGAMSMDSTLLVQGDVSMNSDLSVGGAMSMDSTLLVQGDVSMNSDLSIGGAVNMDSTLLVQGDVSMNSNFSVDGAVSMDSTLLVQGDVSMNSHFSVDGAVSMDSTLLVQGDVSMNSDLSVGGAVNMDSTLLVQGDVSMNSHFSVDGAVNMDSTLLVQGDVSMNNGLSIGGDVSMNSAFSVDGAVSMDSTLLINGDTSMNSDLSVGGNVIINNTLSIIGDTSMNDKLFVAGDASMNSYLSVGGNVIMNNRVTIIGDASMNSGLSVDGTVDINNGLIVNEDVSMNNGLTVNDDVSMNSKLFVVGDVSLNNELFVGGDVSMNNDVFVGGDVSINGVINVMTVNSYDGAVIDGSLNCVDIVANRISAAYIDADNIIYESADISVNSFRTNELAVGGIGYPQTPFHVTGRRDISNANTSDLSNGIAKFNDISGVAGLVLGCIDNNSPYISDCNGTDTNSTGLRFLTQSQTRMMIDSSGNVGIGTTSPTQHLDVNGDALFRGGEIYIGATDRFRLQHNGNNCYMDSFVGGFDFRTGSYTSRMYIASSGNVGIGTNNPEQKLHVNGNIYLGDNDSDMQVIHCGHNIGLSSDANVYIVADANDTSDAAAGGDIVFGSGSNIDMNNPSFSTPTTYPRNEIMRIKGGGGVEIQNGLFHSTQIKEFNFSRGHSNANQARFYWLAAYPRTAENDATYFNLTYSMSYGNGAEYHSRGFYMSGRCECHMKDYGNSGGAANPLPFCNFRNVRPVANLIFSEEPEFYSFVNYSTGYGYLGLCIRNTRSSGCTFRFSGVLNYCGRNSGLKTFNGTVYKNTGSYTSYNHNWTTCYPDTIDDEWSSISGNASNNSTTVFMSNHSAEYFTGHHATYIDDLTNLNREDNIGLIVCANKNDYYSPHNVTRRGIENIEISESLPVTTLAIQPYDKSCFGVIAPDDDKHYNMKRLKLVNSVGEGAIWVSNKNGSLESGDYITTSSIPGYGQKQESEFLANYSVAKITMDCDFTQTKKPTVMVQYDSSNNIVYDDEDQIVWGESTDTSGNLITDIPYKIRHLDPSGNIITEQEYNTKIAASEEAYIAAFVGCTYHCG